MASTSEVSLPKKRRSRSTLECGHCGEVVSKSTYYRHKQQFYNQKTKKWCPGSKGDTGDSVDEDTSIPEMENFLSDDDSADIEPPTILDKTNLEEEDRAFYTSSSSDDDFGSYQNEQIEYWSSSENDDDVDDGDKVIHDGSFPLRAIYLFLLIWQAAYQVSNTAMSSLIRFLKYLILILGRAYKSTLVFPSSQLPLCIGAVHRMLNLDKHNYRVYVVCPKCDSLYEYEDCIKTLSTGMKESTQCCHVTMPNHPQISRRTPCGATLMKNQRTKKGTKLIPIKAYPYRSIKKSMGYFLSKPDFVEKCEHWRNRSTVIPEDYLGDIYDGNVWRKFNSSEYGNFLSVPYSYLLTLNIDWFQPFTRSVYSTGAIYMTIQNLPRNERYRVENVILVGIMPGPKEPKLTVNGYITPLVEELNEFWEGLGFPVNVRGTILNLRIRLALSCIACDIPASRKVCGFLGHAAKLGCNKCRKAFKRIDTPSGLRTDFSGHDYRNWEMRSVESHRNHCNEILKSVTLTALHAAESKYGVRYSVLLSLPYFNPVQYTVIDPMHNLFLGSGKHTFKAWVEKELLNFNCLQKIEDRCKLFHVPADVGRLPINITTGYGGFTANQWCNWITIYSPVVLKGILNDDHLRCWLLFVRACSILRSRIIKRSDILSAHLYLTEFCRECERLYGVFFCTPNMHLHLHLKDCLLDYGPVHSFWCYAFERYNGVLGSIHTNRKSIECQMMTRFCREQEITSL